MKITFLGTSHGIPSEIRYCTCTMFEIGNAIYFVDMGAPAMNMLLRLGKKPENVKAIFTTHLHGDHTNGILEFADLCNWAYRDASLDIYLTEEEGIDAFKKLIYYSESLAPVDEKRLRFGLVKPGFVYEDENIRMTAIPTRHIYNGLPSFAYLLEAEGKKVVFSGDLSGQLAQKDFPAYPLENHVDLMVCEMAHFGIEEVDPYLRQLKADRLLFNHVFPIDKLEKIDALDGRYGYPIRTLADGDVAEL